jgi:hypothetical protein
LTRIIGVAFGAALGVLGLGRDAQHLLLHRRDLGAQRLRIITSRLTFEGRVGLRLQAFRRRFVVTHTGLLIHP